MLLSRVDGDSGVAAVEGMVLVGAVVWVNAVSLVLALMLRW